MANENHDFVVQDDFQVRQKTLLGNEPVKILLRWNNKEEIITGIVSLCVSVPEHVHISVLNSSTNEESRHQQKIGNWSISITQWVI